MRLRNIKGSVEIVESNDYVINHPEEYKGKWNEVFQNNQPIHLEIGMGKGKFIMEHARKHLDVNYIGVEKYSSVLVRALQKIEDEEPSNLRFLCYNAENLLDVFDKEDIDKIYLNFSDPWPKDRHAKRRLTSKEFLQRYDQCLKKDGEIVFKTDNRPLFDFSVEEVKGFGWKLREVTYDLHHSEYVNGNVMTEYEEKFVKEDKPIHRFIAYR